jgi:CRP-like cAMP-binding protein
VDAFKANRLLASFPAEILSLLAPHLRPFGLRLGQNIQKGADVVDTVYFPLSGLISLVVLTDAGHAVESGLVGREGAVNAFEAVYNLPAFGLAMVRGAGSAMTLSATHLQSVALQNLEVLASISRAQAASTVQARQSAACNATHGLESRLARWLLQTRDRLETNNSAAHSGISGDHARRPTDQRIDDGSEFVRMEAHRTRARPSRDH